MTKATREIFERAKAEGGRVDTKDVAKLLRIKLRESFPGVGFSVRISRYAGGSSISVSWIDGPPDGAVDAVCAPYKGGGFDGMIDMAYDSEAFLLPDGSAYFASTSGTEGSGGLVPKGHAMKPDPEAIRVRFGGRYIFAQRNYSDRALANLLTSYAKRFGDDLAEAIRRGEVRVTGSAPYFHIEGAGQIRIGDEWGDMALNRYRSRRWYAPRAAA